MIVLYYIVVFLSSLIYADISQLVILNVGPSIYLCDVAFGYFFLCLLITIYYKRLDGVSIWFKIFMGVIGFGVLYGARQYGFAAFGEGRYFYWIFFFSVPMYLYASGYLNSLERLDKFFKTTYTLVIINVCVLLLVEVLHGGRVFLAAANQEFAGFEDTRGVRYLGSEETFHMGVAVVFLIIQQLTTKTKNVINLALIVILVLLMLFTKNRTAMLSLVAAFFASFFTEGKVALLLKILLVMAVLFLALLWLSPSFFQSVISPMTSVINIKEDDTGNWRLLLQAAAIRQGLQTPILGEGFGGYFNYYIEEMNQTITYPPHSIYVHLFQKTGLLGLLSYILAIFAVIREAIKLKPITQHNVIAEKYRLLFKVLLIAQIPYGFAYGFSAYTGLYIGLLYVLKNIMQNSVKLSDES